METSKHCGIAGRCSLPPPISICCINLSQAIVRFDWKTGKKGGRKAGSKMKVRIEEERKSDGRK